MCEKHFPKKNSTGCSTFSALSEETLELHIPLISSADAPLHQAPDFRSNNNNQVLGLQHKIRHSAYPQVASSLMEEIKE